MIDDGSSDETYSRIETLAKEHDNVFGIQFSRNFGNEAVIYAGLRASDADYVGIVDADLQQPPAMARKMLEALAENDEYDCVAAYQENRRENALVSALKKSFYRVFAKAARSSVIENASDFRVFKRYVADAILELPEYHRFSKGIFAWVGFNTLPMPYTPDERTTGTSKWTITSLFKYAFEGLLSFTTQPLHAIFLLGITVSIVAVIYLIVLVVHTLVNGIDVPGYASTIGLILLMGGGQFLAIGTIGEYLARSYIQEKQRPIYLVRKTIERGKCAYGNETQAQHDCPGRSERQQ